MRTNLTIACLLLTSLPAFAVDTLQVRTDTSSLWHTYEYEEPLFGGVNSLPGYVRTPFILPIRLNLRFRLSMASPLPHPLLIPVLESLAQTSDHLRIILRKISLLVRILTQVV